MKKQKKTLYYRDELNDDFAGTDIKTRTIDENFKYVHKNPIWNFFAFIFYYCIAYPLVWLYERVILRVKFVNAKSVKKVKGCFLYGNHTSFIDAFTPNILSVPRRNRIIVNPDAVSIKGLKSIVQMLGAIPTPSGIKSSKSFLQAIDHFNKKGCNVTIYPEAHIWPYYTGVRPFKDVSFSYPVKHDAPVIAFFTAYTKPKGFLSFLRKANITVYVSDPFYPDKTLSPQERKKDLRDKVYAFMQEKSAFSTYEVFNYVKIAQSQTEERQSERTNAKIA